MGRTNHSITVSSSTQAPPTHPLERAASAWLGNIAADKLELESHGPLSIG